VGCEGPGKRISEQLVAQRLWHHQLDGIAIPSDEDLVLEMMVGRIDQSLRPSKGRARKSSRVGL